MELKTTLIGLQTENCGDYSHPHQSKDNTLSTFQVLDGNVSIRMYLILNFHGEVSIFSGNESGSYKDLIIRH